MSGSVLPPEGGSAALRVVIVEDRATDAELIVSHLEDHGFAPRWVRVDVEATYLAALADDPDVILSDWRLPRFSGERALELARHHVPDVPFVIVSGSIGEELAVDTLHQGADDYVLKDRPARLGPVVRRALDSRQLRLERRRAAEQLAFQAEVLSNVRDAVVSTDLRGCVTSWNAGAEEVFGWAAADVLGRVLPFTDLLRPDEAARIIAGIEVGGPSGQVVPVQVNRHDGRSIWVETRTTSLVDQAGSRVGYLSVARDVTEMQAQRAERDRLAMALEQSSESIVMTDADARIVYVNPAFEAVSGYSRAEVLGHNPRILQSGAQPPELYAAMWRSLASGRSWSGELVNRHKDGSLFRETAFISPVVGPDGTVANYVAVKHDVTREREMEAATTRAQRERELITATIAGLPPRATAEATAAAVAGNVVQLAGLSAVALLGFEHDERAVPLAAVRHDGTRIDLRPFPVPFSQALRLRAHAGLTIEAVEGGRRSADQPVPGALGGDAFASIPLRYDGEVVGLLLAASDGTDAQHVLTANLAALAEFADLAGVLLGDAIRERRSLGRGRAEMERIITVGAFSPVFQPIVELATGAVVGYEALTRFHGQTPPQEVIAAAWSLGLGRRLEEVTLAAAVAAAVELPAGRWLNLNVSPRFAVGSPVLRELLTDVGRPIVIEVTEHDSVADYRLLREAVRGIREDIRIAVDDAGAGAANFQHILELRPDYVKLDIGLVHGIDQDIPRQALLVGMSHFAQASGCQLVAEGVETPEEAATVRLLGARYAQGYLFGRPAAASATTGEPLS